MTDLNTNPLAIPPKDLQERFVIKAIAISVTLAFLGVVSCSMHSNAYEADVIAQEVKLQAEAVKVAEVNATIEIERIKSVETMVNAGANPIALRCMEEGYGRSNEAMVCAAVGIIKKSEE